MKSMIDYLDLFLLKLFLVNFRLFILHMELIIKQYHQLVKEMMQTVLYFLHSKFSLNFPLTVNYSID